MTQWVARFREELVVEDPASIGSATVSGFSGLCPEFLSLEKKRALGELVLEGESGRLWEVRRRVLS